MKQIGYRSVAENVHGSHLLMLFHKARMAFLAAGDALHDTEALAEAFVLLEWLHGILGAVPSGKSDADLCAALLKRVDALLGNIRCRNNYFGVGVSWVPRQSLQQYQTWLDASLASVETLEEYHVAYFSALKQQTTLASHLANVAATVEGEVKHYQEALERTRDDITTTLSAIHQADLAAAEARKVLEGRIASYSNAIRRAFTVPDVTQLLGILESLSFTPEATPTRAAMLISQAGKLLSGSIGSLETATGSYKKEYIVHEIGILGTTIHKLDEGYKIAHDRRIALSDPNAYQLLMKREQFDKMCDTFYTWAPMDQAAQEAAREAMDYYVERIQLRNAAI